MNNAIFGKSCEDLRKRKNIKIIADETKLEKEIAKPQFYAAKIYDSFVAIQHHKTSLVLDRPVYAGFSILELSKTIMYEFHYDYFLHKYPDASLLFTDTDSLMLSCTNK